MFDQTFIEIETESIRPWTIAASFLGQLLLLGLGIVAPLVYTYELPLSDWAKHALLFTPVPPSPPPPAAAPNVAAPKPAARFEAVLTHPIAIPERIAILDEAAGRSSLAALQVPSPGGVPGGLPGGVSGGVLGVTPSMNFQPPPAPVRVGGNVQAAKLIERVAPAYPLEAVEKGITGVVRLEATISKEGFIRELRVLSGDPVLTASAVEAVEQWRYQPTTLNGRAVEVMTQIEINFKLEIPPEEKTGKKRRKIRPRKR